MRRLFYILTFVLCTLSLCTWSQDYARVAERTILGTARYVGMSGAMTAIGGDPSAALDNPAGLGLYRRAEVMLTADLAFDKATSAPTTTRFSLAQASAIFSLTSGKEDKGVIANNFMLSYQRHRTYRRRMYARFETGESLGHLLGTNGVDIGIDYPTARTHDAASFDLRNDGTVNEFGLDWAINYSNRLYAGLGVRLQSWSLMESAEYNELFADTAWLMNRSNVTHSGVGVSLAAGFICRPTGWLRLGISVQTPTMGSFNTYTSGTTETLTDSLYYSWAPDITISDNKFHMPLRLSSSVAFQVGAYGMAAFQYDYSHATYQDDLHTFRAGLEVIPVLGFYINAGYAFESTFVKGESPVGIDVLFERRDTHSIAPHGVHYASAAIGYRGAHMMVQVAYQYRYQKMALFAHPANAYSMNTDTHRVVVTLGWHN